MSLETGKVAAPKVFAQHIFDIWFGDLVFSLPVELHSTCHRPVLQGSLDAAVVVGLGALSGCGRAGQYSIGTNN